LAGAVFSTGLASVDLPSGVAAGVVVANHGRISGLSAAGAGDGACACAALATTDRTNPPTMQASGRLWLFMARPS